MNNTFTKLLQGYNSFRDKYVDGDTSFLPSLSRDGQHPKTMFVACCDSRVDPALLLQCEPGDLFVVRNVANIIPPYEKDESYHGTSAALEFGITGLNVENLIILGHSKCGGIQAALDNTTSNQSDFIHNWVSILDIPSSNSTNADDCARLAVHTSYNNCMDYPWINDKVKKGELTVHRWFFDIKTGQIFSYSEIDNCYKPLGEL